ncbi:hypothetical protein D9M69_425970 [compost metagenome]
MQIARHLHAHRIAGGDIDAFAGHFGEEVDLLLGDHVGRQEVHHVAQRPQQGAALQGVLEDLQAAAFLPGVGCLAGLVLDHFDGQHHAGLAHLGDMGVVDEVGGGGGHAHGQLAVGLDHPVLFEDVQGGQGGGAGQWIAGVGMGVEEGAQGLIIVVETLVDGFGSEHRGHRQVAAGQGLGQHQEVRGDAGLLAGEHGPGAAEAYGDLVVDQVHAVAVAGIAQQLEVHRVVHAHAAGALDQRLDYHRRDLLVVLGQGAFHMGEHGAGVFLPAHALGAQVAVRAGHLEGVQQQRLVGFGEQCDVAHRHRRHRLAVVAVGQGDEALLAFQALVAPEVVAHLQRHFDAGRAVVGIEHPVQALGRDLHQAFGQLDHRLVAESGEDHMLQLVHLVLDALVDARVGVAEDIDPPGADGVQVAFALEVFQPDPLAAADRHHRQAFVILHLGAGVPEHGKVALHPVGIEAHESFSCSDRRSLCKASTRNKQDAICRRQDTSGPADGAGVSCAPLSNDTASPGETLHACSLARLGADRIGGAQRHGAGQGQAADGHRHRRWDGRPDLRLRTAAEGLAGHPARGQAEHRRPFGAGHQRVGRQRQAAAQPLPLPRPVQAEGRAGAGLRAPAGLPGGRPLLLRGRPAQGSPQHRGRPEALRQEPGRPGRLHRRPAQAAGQPHPADPGLHQRRALAGEAEPAAHRQGPGGSAHPLAL